MGVVCQSWHFDRLEVPLLGGQGKMGETGETCETGENFDLFKRRMPAFNWNRIEFSNSPRSNPERRSYNNILTGLTGLADCARLGYRVASERQETPTPEPTANGP